MGVRRWRRGARGVPDTADGHGRDATGPVRQRLFWFGALWLAGVTTVSLVAWIIRSVIVP